MWEGGFQPTSGFNVHSCRNLPIEQGQGIAGKDDDNTRHGGQRPSITLDCGGDDQGDNRKQQGGVGRPVRTDFAHQRQVAAEGDDGAEQGQVKQGERYRGAVGSKVKGFSAIRASASMSSVA